MKIFKMNSSLFLVILLLSFLSVSSGCHYFIEGVDGNGVVVSEDRPVKPFSAIQIGGAFEVILTQGDKVSLKIEADENLLDYIITDVRGGKLIIETEREIRNCKELKAYITFVELESLALSGAVEMMGEGRLEFDELNIDASGATEINMDITAEVLKMDVSGASEVALSGIADGVYIDASGASELSAGDLETRIFFLDISGAGDATIFVKERLDVTVSGAAHVTYLGDPEFVNRDVSGAGSIKSR
ncbi:MAG: DUF2807 domain-containing protein [Bacteroidales bacterium]|nr:DUF2807 domain-containing protein [Bacteroidales bacterium]